MPAEKIDVQRLTRQFHDMYEGLAPRFGYETRPETRKFDPDSTNGELMQAVCAEIARLLLEEAAKVCEAGMDGTSRQYSDACFSCASLIRSLKP